MSSWPLPLTNTRPRCSKPKPNGSRIFRVSSVTWIRDSLFYFIVLPEEALEKNIPYLDAAHLAGALHPGRHVHGVSPYVVVRLPRPDHPRRDRAVVDAHLEHKVVETLLVDARQRLLQLEGEFDEGGQVAPSGPVLGLGRLGYPGRCHVRRAYRLYLDDVLELVLIEDLNRGKGMKFEAKFSLQFFAQQRQFRLERGREGAHRVEIGYDLVQESETFEALVVDALLAVEIGKVGHAGEQYADLGVALAVQVVVVSRPREEIGGHVGREDVVYEGAVPPFHVRSPFPLRHHLPPP